MRFSEKATTIGSNLILRHLTFSVHLLIVNILPLVQMNTKKFSQD